jgi:hypothetical protein
MARPREEAMTALRTASINWALGIGIGFAILLLNAYLDYRHPDAEALTAEVSNDRAAEFAAINKE